MLIICYFFTFISSVIFLSIALNGLWLKLIVKETIVGIGILLASVLEEVPPLWKSSFSCVVCHAAQKSVRISQDVVSDVKLERLFYVCCCVLSLCSRIWCHNEAQTGVKSTNMNFTWKMWDCQRSTFPKCIGTKTLNYCNHMLDLHNIIFFLLFSEKLFGSDLHLNTRYRSKSTDHCYF